MYINLFLHGELNRCCFFFSSRRRHTRCYRDWSSDVCSSDLCRSPLPGGSVGGLPGPVSHPGKGIRDGSEGRFKCWLGGGFSGWEQGSLCQVPTSAVPLGEMLAFDGSQNQRERRVNLRRQVQFL